MCARCGYAGHIVLGDPILHPDQAAELERLSALAERQRAGEPGACPAHVPGHARWCVLGDHPVDVPCAADRGDAARQVEPGEQLMTVIVLDDAGGELYRQRTRAYSPRGALIQLAGQ